MEPRDDAPGNASHYFALLVPVVPLGESKPGEIEVASGDSWIGRRGLMRAFIGKVRAADGEAYEESLFVVDVPANVDITTADSGSATRYPSPPKGVRIRRLTHTTASGTVRGTEAGDRIAYYATAADGTKQIFIIPSDGSDRDPNPDKHPVQATKLPGGVEGGIRWHSSGNSIACISNGGVAVTCVMPGEDFGKSVFLTPQGDGPERIDLVWSQDGSTLAYGREAATKGEDGKPYKTYAGEDPTQIFVCDFPDKNGDGIPDTI
jgi:hypothetical protein